MKDYQESVLKSLKQMRKEKRLTQTEVGKVMGVSHASISDIENGKTHLTLDLIQKYGLALGYEVKIDINFYRKV